MRIRGSRTAFAWLVALLCTGIPSVGAGPPEACGILDALPVIALPAPRECSFDERFEWVLTVDFANGVRLDPLQVGRIFNAPWRRRYGGFLGYGLDAETRRWTYLAGGVGKAGVSQLKFAWSYVYDYKLEGVAADSAVYAARLEAVSSALHSFGSPRLHPSLLPAQAVRKASELREIRRSLDYAVVLTLRASQGEGFAGTAVAEVMSCLGLKLSDQGGFCWENRRAPDGALFTVFTSTPPGYFSAADLTAGTRVVDLVFRFDLPRCPLPMPVFDQMVRACQFARQRLGGEILVDDSPLAATALRSRVQAAVARLVGAGFPPGCADALRVF
jgi:hypothetical protein